MSGMNMKKMIHQARSLVGAGVEQILNSPTAEVDAASKWGHSEMAGCGTPRAVAGIMGTVTTGKKARRRARKRAVKALKHAAREIHHPPLHRTRTTTTWAAAGLLAAATVAGTTIIMVRTLRRRRRCTGQFEVEKGDRIPGGGLAEVPGEHLNSPGQPTNDLPLSVTHANVSESDSGMLTPPAQKVDGPAGA